MKNYEYRRVNSYEEAVQALKDAPDSSVVISGGTDFMNISRDEILPDEPDLVMQIDEIPDAAGVQETKEGWSVGAETKLSALADQKDIPVLSEAAGSIANLQIRNTATVAGNLFQDVRCRYYRYTDFMGGCVTCNRKGGEFCCAMHAESDHHSVFGGMHTHDTPCTSECPLGTDIPGYAEQLRQGNTKKAAQILMKANPFPMLLSRVCPHPCEDKCNQGKFGDSVSIHNMERYLGDYILDHMDEFYYAPKKETGKSVAVVGAGPSGLSAAFYLRKAGHGVTVIERKELAGGVMRYGIPHYRLPKQYLDKVIDALKEMGIRFRMNTEVGKDLAVEDLLDQYDYVYLGTGAWKQPVLGIGKEEIAEFGLNFLTGVATFLTKNMGGRVLVCGGGNVAMDAALTAARLGAEHVTVICLEQEYEMPASREEIERCRAQGVEICCGWGLKEIVANEDGSPKGMMSMKCLSVYDENHRFSPKYSDTEIKLYEADTIILATGQRVDISYLGEDLMSKMASPRGLIDTDLMTGTTKNDRIFAGGDAASGPNIASRATAGGRKAAASICAVAGSISEEEEEEPETFTTINPSGVALTHACGELMRPSSERTLYDEDASTQDRDTILREANRCMNCSCFAVNCSDLTPVLMLLEARFVTTERTLSAEELFTTKKAAKEVLHTGELLKDIRIPKAGYQKLYFEKAEPAKGHDFSHVSLAAGFTMEDGLVKKAGLIFGGVAGIPYEAKDAEEYLKGRPLDTDTIEKAADLAVKDAIPFPDSQERVHDMRQLMRKIMRKAKED